MKCFVFATDGSEYSDLAGDEAYKFLQAFGDATLIVLYVTAKENYAYDLIPKVVDRAEKSNTESIQEKINEKFSPYLDRVRFVHEVGHPSSTICQIAKNNNAEMIIVGSHGKGIIDRALVGSVAHAVLHRAHIPVLIAKD